MDPLTALREYTIKKQLDQITRVENEYRFSTEFSFPAATETAYRSKHSQDHHRYTLETLFHFITNHHLKHTDYMQLARSHKIPAITLPDRKPLLDYLTGKTSSSDSIDPFPATAVTLDTPLEASYSYPPAADPIEMIRANERPLRDREAILECRSRDFYSVLNREVAKREEVKDEEEKPKMMFKTGKVGEGVPIILVPSAYSTLITIYNVKEFLEDGVFIPTEVKVKQMKGVKPDCVTVQKKFSRDRVVTAYEVRDKPSSLKSDDWDRVVAVFVLGKEWQFKDWPFKDHVQIFNKIFGFYLRFEDDSVESARVAKQWNVKIISISKNKRHQDRAAALEVWDRLEEFMRSRSR